MTKKFSKAQLIFVSFFSLSLLLISAVVGAIFHSSGASASNALKKATPSFSGQTSSSLSSAAKSDNKPSSQPASSSKNSQSKLSTKSTNSNSDPDYVLNSVDIPEDIKVPKSQPNESSSSKASVSEKTQAKSENQKAAQEVPSSVKTEVASSSSTPKPAEVKKPEPSQPTQTTTATVTIARTPAPVTKQTPSTTIAAPKVVATQSVKSETTVAFANSLDTLTTIEAATISTGNSSDSSSTSSSSEQSSTSSQLAFVRDTSGNNDLQPTGILGILGNKLIYIGAAIFALVSLFGLVIFKFGNEKTIETRNKVNV